jgi:hypothetical protein
VWGVEWVARKVDSFLAAAVIAVAAIVASQGQVFMTQYMRHLGSQLDAARAQVTAVETGLRYKLMSDTVRGEIEKDTRNRAHALQSEYDAVAKTNIFARPSALARNGDPTLMRGTWHEFVPGLPLTPEDIAYMAVGMVAGFVLYEVIKLPFLFLLREPRRRKFRRRT